MICASPVAYRIRRLLSGGRRKPVEQVAKRSWVECAVPSLAGHRKAIALPDQFDRVTGLSHGKKCWRRESDLLSGVYRESRVTMVHELERASVVGGYIYVGPYKGTLRYNMKERMLWLGCLPRVACGSLVCTVTGNEYFSHWLTDNATLEGLGSSLGEAISVPTPRFSHAKGYREILGLAPTSDNGVYAERIFVFEDVAQNESKRLRYLNLRSRVRKVLSDSGDFGRVPGVMILRGSSGAPRVLENERAVALHLQAHHGFRIVDPSGLSAEEVLTSILGSRIVVGVEGSHMAHGLYSIADNGAFVILQPPFRFNALYKEYTDCIGLDFSYVVGRQTGGHRFRIDLDELDRTLDLVYKAADTCP